MVETDSAYQFAIACEGQVLLMCEDLQTAIIDLIAVYFSFDMSYPKQLYPVLLFMQHHVCNIKDQQIVPNIVNILHKSLQTFAKLYMHP